MLSRREILVGAGAVGVATALPIVAPAQADRHITWFSTTQSRPWQAMSGVEVTRRARGAGVFGSPADVSVRTDRPAQTIDGFGCAFSEIGWAALMKLPAGERSAVFDLLFGADGAGFTVCRTPIGASDFALRWYSYDEVDGDFALRRFSIDNDRNTLIPFIQAARARQPNLRLWASPWSPPTWMKTNRFYAMTANRPGRLQTDIRPDQIGQEGKDYFIQEPRYFEAYARYFARYIDAYAKAGVPIEMVMPQNEFNSAQPFPSCCWTPEGLARFMPYLGEEMDKLGVGIFFGTLERPDSRMLFKVLDDPAAGRFVKGVGIQWGGKGALSKIHEQRPDLPIWATEQECGDGENDWHYARYTWGLMKRYLENGARVYEYWNLALPSDGMSTWGWRQNSLVSVDTVAGRYKLNHEYYLMRHLSAFVKPGARLLPTESYSGFENQLCFLNADGRLVLVMQNDMSEPLRVGLRAEDSVINVTLPADSFNTIVLPEGWNRV